MMRLGEYHFVNECELVETPSQVSKRIKEQEGISDINIYPNPTKDDFTIELPKGVEEAQLVLYNVQGSKVKVQSIREGENNVMVTNLDNGIYFYRIIQQDKIISSGKVQLMK